MGVNSVMAAEPDESANDCDEWNMEWTGHHCCGDDSDTGNEYYNDVLGGCWNSNPVSGGSFPRQAGNYIPSVVNINGRFEGCKISNDLAQLHDMYTDGQLINNNDYCTIRNAGQKRYFCSYIGEWLETDANSLVSKQMPWEDTEAQQAGCCKQEECWAGFGCIADMRFSQNDYNGYRCILENNIANWIQQERSLNWDHSDSGYCPEQNQCFVISTGNIEVTDPLAYYTDDQPVCINNSDYIEDHLCYHGTWVSRTRYLAKVFNNLGTNWPGCNGWWPCRGEWGDWGYTLWEHTPFVFYCDEAKNIVNHYRSNSNIKNLFEGEGCLTPNDEPVRCANKLCVLRYAEYYVEENIILATSLNTGIKESGILDKVFKVDKTACDSLVGTGNYYFTQCPGTRVYYSDGLNAVFYSPEHPSGYFGGGIYYYDIDDAFGVFIGLEDRVAEFFDESEPRMQNEFGGGLVINALSDFDEMLEYSTDHGRLYKYVESGYNEGQRFVHTGEVIYGLIEPVPQGTYIFLTFWNFDVNLCDAIDHKVTSICYKDGDNYTIFMHENLPYYEQGNLEEFITEYWPDFTSRLRIGEMALEYIPTSTSSMIHPQPVSGLISIFDIFRQGNINQPVDSIDLIGDTGRLQQESGRQV